MANPNTHLFEVNLINDRVRHLLRRRAFQQLFAAASLAMLGLCAVLAVFIVTRMTIALRVRGALSGSREQLKGQQQICEDLDRLKAATEAGTRPIAPLLPIVRLRVAWTPKLVALADALPAGAGVLSVQASHGDFFAALASAAASAGANPASREETALPQMVITLLYAPAEGGEENPIAFLDRLRQSRPFMDKLDFVRLEAIEHESWHAEPVMTLRSSARGARVQ